MFKFTPLKQFENEFKFYPSQPSTLAGRTSQCYNQNLPKSLSALAHLSTVRRKQSLASNNGSYCMPNLVVGGNTYYS